MFIVLQRLLKSLWFGALCLIVASCGLFAYAADQNTASDTTNLVQQILNWFCDNKAWLLPIVLGGSWLSAFTDKMPPWLAQIIHFISLNWADIARAFLSHNPPPMASGKK